jgi:hypothetical protein
MQLQQLSIQGPGSQGLNSELSPFQQSIEFALKADNAVIDRVGRLAAREAFADFVWENNFALKDNEDYDIVRMETVMYDQQTPATNEVWKISKYSDEAYEPLPDRDADGNPINPEQLSDLLKVGAEYNMAEYNGLLLTDNADPRDITRHNALRFVEQAQGSQYAIGQYGYKDEYNGGFTTSFDDHTVIGIAGIYIPEQRYNAEYNRPQSEYGVMEYAQERDFKVQNYDYYIVFELRGPKLYRLGQWTPKNGLTKCQLVPFMDSIFLFSAGEPPIAFHKGSSALISSHPDYKPPRDGDRGNDENGVPFGLNVLAPELNGDVACAAYGRLWVSGVNGNYDVIYYSDLLVPYQWYDGSIDSEQGLPEGEDPFNTGGIIDVREYWPTGNDKIQGIAAHNGFLIVFGRHSILIYAGAQGDPAGEAGLRLQDAIRDVGLVNQDAMCNIGSDHLFVDPMGVRSLGRVVQEKSVPLAEPSLNVATVIREQIAENRDTVRLHHFISKSLAVCLFPFDREAFVFQLGQPSATGGLRTTFWTDCDWYDGCAVRTDYKTRELLGGMESRGVTMYDGYDQPIRYTMSYESTVLLGGDNLMTTMIPKSVLYSFHHDHSEVPHEDIKLYSRWGFGTEEMPYMAKCHMKQNQKQSNFNTCKVNMAGSGEMLRIGFDVPIHNHPFSMQQISINTHSGRRTV